MGLMDKVKAQANQLAQKTQETAREGKARIDQAQANRHADTLLRNLGAMVFAERTGRGAPDSQDQITRLIGEISAHEAEHGINLTSQPTGWMPGTQPQGDPGSPGGPGSTPFAGGPAGPGSAPFGDPGATAFPDAGGGTAFPETGGPTAFPETGGPTAFPETGGPTSFPDAGGPTSFPDAGGGTAFPPSDPTSFPQSSGEAFPDTGTATSFPPSEPTASPDADEGTGFPPEAGPTPSS